MKPTTIMFAILLFAACDKREPTPDTTSTGDSSSSTGDESTGSSAATTTADTDSSSTGGYVCDDVGAPCDLAGDAACGQGLLCRPTAPFEVGQPPPPGVCAAPCSTDPGPTFQPCQVGWCDNDLGMCRDSDGLPTGLCPGLPGCAGDACEGECGAGMECMFGECAWPCDTLADCPASADACKVGTCFTGDSLADACT